MWSSFTLAFAGFACAPLPSTPSALTESVADLAPHHEPAGLTYEVYIRSFQDSNGDGVGDLEGVRERLDYLADLGVRTLWLMPIFPAFGPAGYDVTDFSTVTEEYGDLDSLRALVADAHAQGMRVLLDLPFNHAFRNHPWFVAAESGDEEARGLFVYRAEPADGERWFTSAQGGSYYARFGADMPDFDWTSPGTAAALDPIFDGWLNVGADGYRLDAVLMLVEAAGVTEGSAASHEEVGRWVERGRAAHPDAFFLAEASEWTVPASISWLDGSDTITVDAPGADAVLDFPRYDAFLDAVETESGAPIAAVVDAEAAAGADGMVGFLGSHDVERLPSAVPNAQLRRTLRTIQLLLPGSPVLYYGEELDLADATTGTGQDYAMRAPMPWTPESGAGFTTGTPWFPPDPSYESGASVAAESADPASMLSLTKGLSCVREAYALDDDATWTRVDADPRLLVFGRETAAGALLVVANLSSASATFPSIDLDGLELGDLATGLPAAPTPIPAYGARVLGSSAGCIVAP